MGKASKTRSGKRWSIEQQLQYGCQEILRVKGQIDAVIHDLTHEDSKLQGKYYPLWNFVVDLQKEKQDLRDWQRSLSGE